MYSAAYMQFKRNTAVPEIPRRRISQYIFNSMVFNHPVKISVSKNELLGDEFHPRCYRKEIYGVRENLKRSAD